MLGREDVPEIETFIEFVRGDFDLASKIAPFRQSPSTEDFESAFFDLEACFFLTRIISRAEALGTTDDGSILFVYCEMERAKFAAQLTTQILVPIALTRLQLEEPLQLAPGVRIEVMDDETQRARAVSSVYLNRVPAYLIAAATHAIVVDDVVIANPHAFAREVRTEMTDEGIDLSAVDRVIEALQIVSNQETGYGQICARPADWADRWKADLPNVMSIRTPRRFPPRFADGGWNDSGSYIPAAEVELLPMAYQALLAGTPRVLLAARRTVSASMRNDSDDVTIDACIGIEALVGKETDEITHRLAQRSAVALAKGSDPSDPELVYGLIKDVYANRSAIVHGAAERRRKPIIRNGKAYDPSTVAPSLLRGLLRSWMEFGWTPESLDTELLRGLRADSEGA
jgi:hypothetical protein